MILRCADCQIAFATNGDFDEHRAECLRNSAAAVDVAGPWNETRVAKVERLKDCEREAHRWIHLLRRSARLRCLCPELMEQMEERREQIRAARLKLLVESETE